MENTRGPEAEPSTTSAKHALKNRSNPVTLLLLFSAILFAFFKDFFSRRRSWVPQEEEQAEASNAPVCPAAHLQLQDQTNYKAVTLSGLTQGFAAGIAAALVAVALSAQWLPHLKSLLSAKVRAERTKSFVFELTQKDGETYFAQDAPLSFTAKLTEGAAHPHLDYLDITYLLAPQKVTVFRAFDLPIPKEILWTKEELNCRTKIQWLMPSGDDSKSLIVVIITASEIQSVDPPCPILGAGN